MRRKWIAMAALLSLLLCSCGSENTSEQLETDGQESMQKETVEKIYEMNEITVPDADEALGELFPEDGRRNVLAEGVAGDRIYRMVQIYPEYSSLNGAEYYVQILEPPYMEWAACSVDMTAYTQESGCYVRESFVAADGTIKFLFKTQNIDYVGQWNEENGVSARELPEEIDLEGTFYNHLFPRWYYDEEDGLFFLNEEMVLRYDENGARQSTALANTGGLIFEIQENPYSGILYFMGVDAETWFVSEGSFRIDNGGFSVWTADSEEAVFAARDSSGNGSDVFLSGMGSECVAFASETEGYIADRNGIYYFSMEDRTLRGIYSFVDAGMGPDTPSEIRSIEMSVGEDGTLLILGESANDTKWAAKLAEQTAEDESEKQELELALMWDDSFLKKAVVDFNKQSDKYQIVIRVCSSEEMDDYRNRIQAELSAGEGPDIIERSVLDLKAGAEKGYLLELTEYSEAFQETLFPAVAQLGKVDGKYYGIPYEFNVQTLVANREVVGERQGWSLEELMQCMEQSGAKNAVAGMDGAFSYYYLGARTENPGFIDWENGVSHLNEGQGCELLEFVMRYSQTDGETGGSTYEQVADGESLTEVIYTLIPAMALSVSDSLQGREVYIGFPTEDHSGGHCLTGSILEVNRNSADTEGALAFIEYLLSVEQQSYLADSMLYGSGISDYPVRNDTLTELFDAFRRNAKEQEGEENYGVSYLTSEQYDALWEVLENAKLYDNDTEIVLDMLLEEGGAYRAGTKTAQQVMDVINNRVQLYLDESK